MKVTYYQPITDQLLDLKQDAEQTGRKIKHVELTEGEADRLYRELCWAAMPTLTQFKGNMTGGTYVMVLGIKLKLLGL